jgi:hypothetical protein
MAAAVVHWAEAETAVALRAAAAMAEVGSALVVAAREAAAWWAAR